LSTGPPARSGVFGLGNVEFSNRSFSSKAVNLEQDRYVVVEQ
jgi:hypothetical protein